MMRLSLIAAALLAAGCSPQPKGDSYFPLTIGSSWTYEVTSDIDGTVSHDRQISSVSRTIDQDDTGQVIVRRSETAGRGTIAPGRAGNNHNLHRVLNSPPRPVHPPTTQWHVDLLRSRLRQIRAQIGTAG